MLRPVPPRTTFAAPPVREAGGARAMRRFATGCWAALARVILSPLALALAALAGVLFAILLPICGIATIAEAVAKGGWGFVRDAFSRPAARGVRQN